MRIAIAGATGLIGRQLTTLARTEGHEVVEIARETGFDLLSPTGLGNALDGVDTAAGRVATILTLQRSLTTPGGAFGASGADGPVPLG